MTRSNSNLQIIHFCHVLPCKTGYCLCPHMGICGVTAAVTITPQQSERSFTTYTIGKGISLACIPSLGNVLFWWKHMSPLDMRSPVPSLFNIHSYVPLPLRHGGCSWSAIRLQHHAPWGLAWHPPVSMVTAAPAQVSHGPRQVETSPADRALAHGMSLSLRLWDVRDAPLYMALYSSP